MLVALIAIAKAVGYYYQRFTLDFSSNGYVQGAGYTDVHARLPAYTLLFWISLLAAMILLVNIRGRGLAASRSRSRALGLRRSCRWCDLPGGRPGPESEPGAEHARVAVHPAQHQCDAGGVQPDAVERHPGVRMPATQSLTPAEEQSDAATFNDIRLWDPTQSLTGATYTKLQQERSYLPVHHAGARPLHGQRNADSYDRRGRGR